MTLLVDSLLHAVMITGFVAVMMLTVEYLNVLMGGHLRERVSSSSWSMYLIAAALGVLPGCLGSFAVVSLFAHRVVTLGALVTTMIATSGDEAFVMFALIPGPALALHGLLFVIAIAAGVLTDRLAKDRALLPAEACVGLQVHTPQSCECYPYGRILAQWRPPSGVRIALAGALLLYGSASITGFVGPEEWNWVRWTILLVVSVTLFIVSTVPDHFLRDHLWKHVARSHVPRVFLWTWGALAVTHALTQHLDLATIVADNRWAVLAAASAVGILPESGPHLLFVTLFAQGSIPFSILVANSIVQDGHGMLPLLANSRRAFFSVKAIDLIVGLVVGGLLLAFGL